MNIDIGAWIAGTAMTASSIIGYIISQPIINAMLNIAAQNQMDPNAMPIVNTLIAIWRPMMVLFAVSGIIYIIYSSLRQEYEYRYV